MKNSSNVMNNKRHISAFTAFVMTLTLFLGSVSSIPVMAGETNLIPNSSFEQWDGSKPEGWNGKFESAQKSDVQKHSGEFSVKHTSSSSTKDISYEIEGIIPGQEYEISYWYYDNDDKAKTRPWMAWRDAEDKSDLNDNKDVLQPGDCAENNEGWQQFKTTLTAPENAVKFRFEVRVYKENGDGGAVYYDDFSFVKAGETTDPNVKKVESISANVTPGQVALGTSVELKTSTTGCTIYFTLDGSDPEEDLSGTTELYNEPIVINGDTTIKAVGVKEDYENSDIATLTYTIDKSGEVISIEEARSLENKRKVRVKGVVTARIGSAAFLQDSTAGIYLYSGSNKREELKVGNEIEILGTLAEYKGLKQIANYESITVNSEGNDLPVAKEITIKDVSEEYEGTLITLKSVEIKEVPGDKDKDYSIKVTDGTDEIDLRVDKWLENEIHSSKYEAGMIVNVTAPVGCFTNYQLMLRSENDIEINNTMVQPIKAVPGSGEVFEGTKVTLSTITEGAKILYTVDGSEPADEVGGSTKEYCEPIIINEATTIKAYGKKEGLTNTEVKEFNYTIGSNEGFTPIYEIQGEVHVSPFKGQDVKVKGIVTAVSTDYYDAGLYIQDGEGDKNSKTSDGIFVRGKFSAKPGDLVAVEGTVTEKLKYPAKGNDDAGQLSITEIAGKTVNVIGENNVIPEPIIIGKNGMTPSTTIIDNDKFAEFDPEEDAIDFYESLEGMLVKVENPLIVGVEERYGTFNALADKGEASLDKLSVKKGIIPTKENFNPEILHIDDVVVPLSNKDKVFIESRFNNAKVGDSFSDSVVGVMDYNFGSYKIYNISKLPDIVPGENDRETTTIEFDKDKLTVAEYNIENFAASKDQTPDEKVERIADSIINDLKSPDIIGLVEVQDNNGPINDGGSDGSESYKRLINTIKELNGPEYGFTDIAPVNNQDGGQPGGNIRVGYIYRIDRVQLAQGEKGGATEKAVMNGENLAKNPSRVDPTNSNFSNTRKSLVSEFIFKGESVFVIANHLSSKRGDEPEFGKNQPPVKGSEPRRHEQARAVNTFVKEILAAKADANIVVLGDMNDYEFSETLQVLKGDELTNMVELLPKNERYTYVYGGNSQVLDNMLVSKNIEEDTLIDVVHLNAEFTEHSGRASDHDPVMIQIANIGEEENGRVSIKEARNLPNDTKVKIKGIVTTKIGNAAFLQDNTAGIYLYSGSNKREELKVGNEIEIVGTLGEFNGLKQLKNYESVVVKSENNSLPKPVELSIKEIGEKYEGMLVTLKGVEIKELPQEAVKNYSIKVTDGTNDIDLRVDKWLENEIDSSKYKAGMKINVTAPVGCFKKYQLMLRSEEDIKIFNGDKKIKIENVVTTDIKGTEKNSFVEDTTIMVKTTIKVPVDTKGTIIVTITDKNDYHYFVSFLNDMELKEGVENTFSLGTTMGNAAPGNYKAKVYVWDSLSSMKPLSEVGKFQFTITK